MTAVSNPLVIWLCAAGALAMALRTRRSQDAPREDRAVPAALRIAATLPAPGVLVERLVANRRTIDAIGASGLRPIVPVAAALARARIGLGQVGVAAGVVGSLASPVLAGVGALVGAGMSLLPLRWLYGLARRRRAAVVRELPDLIDLVVICTQAGMSLEPALRLAAERLPGALSTEIATTLRELDLGTPRRDAYVALSRRMGVTQLTGLVGALLQADELGAPIAGVLRRQADLLRSSRRQDVRDRAATAAPKVQLVVAMVMVPSALLVILGVLVLHLVGEIGGVVGGTG